MTPQSNKRAKYAETDYSNRPAKIIVLESQSDTGESVDSVVEENRTKMATFHIAPVRRRSRKPATLGVIFECAEDEMPSRKIVKKSRKFEKWQLAILKTLFEANLPGAYLTADEYAEIGRRTALTKEQVAKWFSNRRWKQKSVAKMA